MNLAEEQVNLSRSFEIVLVTFAHVSKLGLNGDERFVTIEEPEIAVFDAVW